MQQDRNGVEALAGESEAEYVARQHQLREEAAERMRAKFGSSGGLNGRMGGCGSSGCGSHGCRNGGSNELLSSIGGAASSGLSGLASAASIGASIGFSALKVGASAAANAVSAVKGSATQQVAAYRNTSYNSSMSAHGPEPDDEVDDPHDISDLLSGGGGGDGISDRKNGRASDSFAAAPISAAGPAPADEWDASDEWGHPNEAAYAGSSLQSTQGRSVDALTTGMETLTTGVDTLTTEWHPSPARASPARALSGATPRPRAVRKTLSKDDKTWDDFDRW